MQTLMPPDRRIYKYEKIILDTLYVDKKEARQKKDAP